MSLNEAPNPSAQWKAFLQDVDQLLQTAVELHCLGGFVLSVLYDLPRPTADVDYIAAMPSTAIVELETIAGRGSALHKKHGLYLQHVTIADVPEDFAARLTELSPGAFARLRLFALEVHDLVLAKLVRNSPVDLEDGSTRVSSNYGTQKNCSLISPTNPGMTLRSSSGSKPAFLLSVF
jgi:hypothetical protein